MAVGIHRTGPLSAKVHTNYAEKRRSLGRYSSLVATKFSFSFSRQDGENHRHLEFWHRNILNIQLAEQSVTGMTALQQSYEKL
jgi:hypothetical protein